MPVRYVYKPLSMFPSRPIKLTSWERVTCCSCYTHVEHAALWWTKNIVCIKQCTWWWWWSMEKNVSN